MPNDNDIEPISAADQPAPEPSELDQFKAQAAENWDKYLRSVADLENYRKRVGREREEWNRSAREQVITALLPALDNLERALEHSQAGTPLHEGLEQVHAQFKRALADFGLAELTVQPGDLFDPNRHEALNSIASPDQPEGAIVQQVQSGYQLAEKLLRPVRVVVSKGASPA